MVMNESISQVYIKWRKDIDNAILGEIKQKAIENGIKTEYVLNEKAIISALEKQIPKKPSETDKARCIHCGCVVKRDERFCHNCGQALDWSDTQ